MESANNKLSLKKRILKSLKKWLMVILNPRLLLCIFIAWMITNGWSYVFTVIGTLLEIPWMIITGGAYMSLLWVPFTPEKILTVIIAVFLMRLIFPNDKKTIGVLREELSKLKATYIRQRNKRRQKRIAKKPQ
ncbi:MAG: hypothetical protein E7513_06380 [Ruminococcaceae bacterium]|nr:hypothetical protein [Oscillospiraceae bacterium]